MMDAYVFYFQLRIANSDFKRDKKGYQERIRAFEENARALSLPYGPRGAVHVAGGMVHASVAREELSADYAVLDFAAKVASGARSAGVHHFFGAVTAGEHTVDLERARELVEHAFPRRRDSAEKAISPSRGDLPPDPLIRGVLADRWSEALRAAGNLVAVPNRLWVGLEAFEDGGEALSGTITPTIRVHMDQQINLSILPLRGGTMWPFPGFARFTPVTLYQ